MKWKESFKHKFQDYWRRIHQYTGLKLTKGSEHIKRLFHFAHKDNWRRPRK